MNGNSIGAVVPFKELVVRFIGNFKMFVGAKLMMLSLIF